MTQRNLLNLRRKCEGISGDGGDFHAERLMRLLTVVEIDPTVNNADAMLQFFQAVAMDVVPIGIDSAGDRS